MIDLTGEIKLHTTRSGGAGGQNVNKVETAVQAYFDVPGSALLSEDQKMVVLHKLHNRINAEGQLMVKAQMHRTQIQNKAAAIAKINELVAEALKKKRLRIATKPGKAAKEKRIDQKKRAGSIKNDRRRIRPTDL